MKTVRKLLCFGEKKTNLTKMLKRADITPKFCDLCDTMNDPMEFPNNAGTK